MINEQKLRKLLHEAKVNTYARSGEGGEAKLKNGGKKFEYRKGKFYYQDIYFGYNPFVGEEIIFYQQNPVWGMNYYGQVITKNIPAKDIYSFLKKALRKPNLASPYRGPDVYKSGDLKYVNKAEGHIDDFKGREKIYYKNKLIYILNYHGGSL